MAHRFASPTEQEIEKLLKQKDSENKRRLTQKKAGTVPSQLL